MVEVKMMQLESDYYRLNLNLYSEMQPQIITRLLDILDYIIHVIRFYRIPTEHKIGKQLHLTHTYFLSILPFYSTYFQLVLRLSDFGEQVTHSLNTAVAGQLSERIHYAGRSWELKPTNVTRDDLAYIFYRRENCVTLGSE